MSAPVSPGTIARIAAEEFTRRRAAAQRKFDEGQWPGDPINEAMRLWLAIAAAAGAKLPELEVTAIVPLGKTCAITASTIAEPHAYLAELARARDTAIAKAEAAPKDLAADQRARDLIALAEALGAPGIDWSKASEGRAAA